MNSLLECIAYTTSYGGPFMCLIAFSYKVHPSYPLIVVANRDEFYDRPTAAAHFWEDEPEILAGRDLRQQGSWMGLSKNGRFAAITNYRDPRLPETGQLSRGEIVRLFLTATESTDAFIQSLRSKRDLYGGFNVLLYDGEDMHHYNNIYDEHSMIESGIHGVSNATFNTPWPKVTAAKTVLENTVEEDAVEMNTLISLLANAEIAQDEVLPNTGVGIHLERSLSAQFVKLPNYGTRCSTAIVFKNNREIDFLERTYENGKFKFDRSYRINAGE